MKPDEFLRNTNLLKSWKVIICNRSNQPKSENKLQRNNNTTDVEYSTNIWVKKEEKHVIICRSVYTDLQ